MDLKRSYEFFQPEKMEGRVHIIGCGAVGSTLAENLAHLGVKQFSLYDFDTVEPHNVANQMFTSEDIGKLKVDAVAEMITKINPDIALEKRSLRLYKHGYSDQQLDGYVFLAVDNIDLRRRIVEENKANPLIKYIFDFQVGLEDSQHFAADWRKASDIERLLSTMNFSHEEAKAAQPVSACNEPLSVAPTIRSIVSLGVANFMNVVKGKPWKHLILFNPFEYGMKVY